jgi:predicted small integral membrane protein
MLQQVNLKDAERKVFITISNDGLVDIFLGCFFLMFTIAPYLSTRLGDFWSSAVFLPFWALVYLAIWLTRKYVVRPRIGMVKFGQTRKKKLMTFTLIMLLINLLALVLGVIAAMTFKQVPGQMISVIFGLILLIGFSIAAYFLDFYRLYIYGLLAGISPLIGEWLWNHGYATHHGFPITFGTVAGIMITAGLIVFIRLLRNNPIPAEEA